MERIFNTTIYSLYEDWDEFVGVVGSKSKSLADSCGQHRSGDRAEERGQEAVNARDSSFPCNVYSP